MTSTRTRLAGAATCVTVTVLALMSSCQSHPHTTTPHATPTTVPGLHTQALHPTPVPPSPNTSAAPSPDSTPLPDAPTAQPLPADLDTSNIDQVALASVHAFNAFDTTLDRTPHDTLLRALNYASPAFAHSITTTAPIAAAGADWATFQQHDAYAVITTTLSGDDHPADTATTADRSVIITLTPRGRDGWSATTTLTVIAVELVHLDHGWRIDSYLPED